MADSPPEDDGSHLTRWPLSTGIPKAGTELPPIDPDDPEVVACHGPTLRELHTAAIQNMIAPFAAALGAMNRQIAARIQEETAEISIAAVCPAHLGEWAKQELDRRTEAFVEAHRISPRSADHTPRYQAAKSLFDDLCHARVC